MPELEGDAENPQTEEGEDLGIGETWWHTGKSSGALELGYFANPEQT